MLLKYADDDDDGILLLKTFFLNRENRNHTTFLNALKPGNPVEREELNEQRRKKVEIGNRVIYIFYS